MSTLLDRIKALMDEHDINAKQFTKELGISNSSFTDWKKGKGSPSLDTVVKISDYFKVSLDYLVRGEEIPVTRTLDFSSSLDRELLDKFHSLPPYLQEKLLAYADGMLSAMPKQDTGEERLSV